MGMVGNFEKNSIAIYDRLYCGHPIMAAHVEAGNHFIVRTRTTGVTTPKPVKHLLQSGKKEMVVDWYPHKKEGHNGIKVRLVKVKTHKNRTAMVLATNLSKEQFSGKDLVKLYQSRWAIETSLRDLTTTLKTEQWHSKKVNGIMQEIFVLLWYVNNIKIQMAAMEWSEDWVERIYTRANFKLCAKLVMDNIGLLLRNKCRELTRLLVFWIKRSREKRHRYSRFYPREVKRKTSKFPVHSKVPRRKTP